MTANAVIGLVLGVSIVILFGWLYFKGKEKRWYKVYTAGDRCYLLYRDWNERMWRTNNYYLRFKDELDSEYSFPAQGHWVLMMVEVKMDELEIAKQEVENYNQAKSESETV